MRVLIASHPTTSWASSTLAPLSDRHEISRCSALDLAAWGDAIVDADVVVIPATGLPKEILDRAGRLRLIQKMGAGFDRLDLVSATARGIPVAVTAGANATTVAEHTLLLMLSLARGVDYQRAAMNRGDWRDYPRAVQAVELDQATLGIVGLGAIGIEIA